jgi:hypothetical protein
MDEPTTTVGVEELKRLHSCERAWLAVVDALREGGDDFLLRGPTGLASVLDEIKRLQRIAKLES